MNKVPFLKHRRWEEFETNNSVGLITTLLSEQFLKESFNVKSLSLENYIEEIKLNNIDTVFIDNELYETDHIWYRKSRSYIVNFLKNNNINLVVIQNTTLDVNHIFKNSFLMSVRTEINSYNLNDYVLEIPLLINTNEYNPINSKKDKGIIYFGLGEKKTSPEVKLYNKIHKPNFIILAESVITRSLLSKLFSFVKKVKVLYICKSTKLDKVTLEFIERIAFLNNTYIIFDYSYDYTPIYGYNSKKDSSNVAQLRIILNNENYRFKKVLSAQREVLRVNTHLLRNSLYSFINDRINESIIPEISVITSTNRKKNLDEYIFQMNEQKDVNIEINLVTHGFKLTKNEIENYKSKSVFPLNIIFMSEFNSLGLCLNKCINSSKNPVIAKIDDDDYYLEYYLFDQWLALKYSSADMTGKLDGFYYFENEDLVARRNTGKNCQYNDFIMGASIMIKSDLIKDLMFNDLSSGEDTDLLKRVNEIGGKIYINHPFEMCVFRATDKENHAWKVNDLAMLRSSEIVSFGKPQSYVKLNQI